MNLDHILNLSRNKMSLKDKKVAMIFDMIDRLHTRDISEGDFDEIHNSIRKIWRKNYPLEDLTSQNVNKTNGVKE